MLGLGVDGGQFLAGGAGWCADGAVRGAEGGGAVARLAAGAGARAEGGRVDEDEEAGFGEVGVGEVGEDGLWG